MADAAERPPLELVEILKALDAHHVEYVIIGGVAGRLHGDATLTYDLDITPEPGRENLDRLAGALKQMGVGLRAPGVNEPLSFDFDAASISRFTTMATRGPLGDLDIVLRPDGIPGGYQQLAGGALQEAAYGVTIAVAGLPDLIAARRGAARMTGLERYTIAADRLEAMQSERHPQVGSSDQQAKDIARASFPSPPGRSSNMPTPDQPRPAIPPRERGTDCER